MRLIPTGSGRRGRATSKPFPPRGRQPALRKPPHESRPAKAKQDSADHVARPVGARPDPGEARQHDHDGGRYPEQRTETRIDPWREREREHEGHPREEDGVPAGIAEACGRVEDVDEVRRRPRPRDHELDDVVEKAGDAADGHQPAGSALYEEENDDRDNANQDLPDAGTGVEQLQRVDERAPVELLDDGGDRNVDRKYLVGLDQDGVDREEDEDGEDG